MRKIDIQSGKEEYKYIEVKKRREELDINLKARSSLDLLVIIYVKKNCDCICNVKLNVLKPNSKGIIKMYAVADGSSILEIQGEIHVGKGAENSSVELIQKGVLLSEKASINFEPFLKFFDNRISGKHSTSISSLADDQQYYMQSRGIEHSSCGRLFVDALLHIPQKYTRI